MHSCSPCPPHVMRNPVRLSPLLRFDMLSSGSSSSPSPSPAQRRLLPFGPAADDAPPPAFPNIFRHWSKASSENSNVPASAGSVYSNVWNRLTGMKAVAGLQLMTSIEVTQLDVSQINVPLSVFTSSTDTSKPASDIFMMAFLPLAWYTGGEGHSAYMSEPYASQ